jgi:ABC-type uncharacterized transport system substrate-binding protein
MAAVPFLFVFSPECLSHPHVFIENSITMVFDQEGLSGLQVKWVFDEFFTSMIVGDFDRNQNKKIEKPEIAHIKKDAFSNLINFEYFTFIKIERKPFKVKYIRNFSAALDGEKLVYEFLIPCHVKTASTFKEVRVSQYDPSYYTVVSFAKKLPIKIKGGENFEISYHIAKNLKESFYFGQLHPVEVIVKFRFNHD